MGARPYVLATLAVFLAGRANGQSKFLRAQQQYDASCIDREGEGFDRLRCTQAAAAFQAIAAANPRDANARYYFGSATLRLLDPQDAGFEEKQAAGVAALRDAIRLAPRMIRAYYELAAAVADTPEGESLLRKVLTIDPKQVRAYETLLAILENNGQTTELLTLYRQYRAAWPLRAGDLPETDVDVALYLERTGHLPDAASVLDGVLASSAITGENARSLCAEFLDVKAETYKAYPRVTDTLARLRKEGGCRQ